jgi:ankyrin repeat protein
MGFDRRLPDAAVAIMKLITLKSFPIRLAQAASLVLLVTAAAGAPPRIDQDYFATLRTGDPQELRAALEAGSPVNARDDRGNTPLMLAAVYGDAQSMQVLLDRGADANATNAAGATALMRAAVDEKKVRLLLAHGADVNARSASGNTPLILAARPANSHRTVELLLRHGADARAVTAFGGTALMAAAAGGDARSVRLLLAHGADPNAQPAPNDPGFIFGGGRSPLMWAAFRGDVEIIKLLIAAGADVNAPSGLGTPLAQAAWADRVEAAQRLLDHGANPNIAGFVDGYSALHWAASTEEADNSLVKLLLQHGADPNLGGGEPVDAFLGTPQTPLMLARRRGDTDVLQALIAAGAVKETPDRTGAVSVPERSLPPQLEGHLTRAAIESAVAPLQKTSLESKQAFVRHESAQDCTSCHQQHLPMAAIGLARKFDARVDREAEAALIAIVCEGEMKDPEVDWQPLFHPDAVQTKGYELLAYAAQDLPADDNTDAWVHHLAAIQDADGRWHNNLPRPPLQTGDIGATALAIHALQRYPLPGREAEFQQRVARARQWLWKQSSANTDSRAYQLLGLAWAGESPRKLKSLAKALLAEQRADGGWAQLPGLESDAYATGQVLYALRVAAGLKRTDPAIDRGTRHLLTTQLADGTWRVRRRAFPFQPTMNSGFPHGRDSWISAAGTSWAVMALSLPDREPGLLAKPASARKTAFRR